MKSSTNTAYGLTSLKKNKKQTNKKTKQNTQEHEQQNFKGCQIRYSSLLELL